MATPKLHLPLVDRPEVVRAHVLHAAMSGACVLLSVGSAGWGRMFGRFAPEDPLGHVLFEPDLGRGEPFPSLAADDPLLAEYWIGGAFYRFRSRLHSFAGGGRLRIALPARVERHDRRLVPRVAAGPDLECTASVLLDGEMVEMEVVDISAAGACIRLDPALGPVHPGDRREVWIRVEDCPRFAVILHVHHVREDARGRLAGASIERIDAGDRRRLAALVLEAGRRRTEVA